jgi:hypothetical protein
MPVALMLVGIMAALVFAVCSDWPLAHMIWLAPVVGSISAVLVVLLTEVRRKN